jgi:hypothetical protein
MKEQAEWLIKMGNREKINFVHMQPPMNVDGFDALYFLALSHEQIVKSYAYSLADEAARQNIPFIWAIEHTPHPFAYRQLTDFDEYENAMVLFEMLVELKEEAKRKKSSLFSLFQKKKIESPSMDESGSMSADNNILLTTEKEEDTAWWNEEIPTESLSDNMEQIPEADQDNQEFGLEPLEDLLLEHPHQEDEQPLKTMEGFTEKQEQEEKEFQGEPVPPARSTQESFFESKPAARRSFFDTASSTPISQRSSMVLPDESNEEITVTHLKNVIAVSGARRGVGASFVAWNLAYALQAVVMEGKSTDTLAKWVKPEESVDREQFLFGEQSFKHPVFANKELQSNEELMLLQRQASFRKIVVDCSIESKVWELAQYKVFVITPDPQFRATDIPEGALVVLNRYPDEFPVLPQEFFNHPIDLVIADQPKEVLFSLWAKTPWLQRQPESIQDQWKRLIQSNHH